MQNAFDSRWRLAALAACTAMLFSTGTAARSVSGNARAVQATLASPLGLSTTTLADTGSLGGPTDARHASAPTGSIPALLSGRTLHAATIGWSDQVSSEASIAGLAINIGGLTVSADLVLARAISFAGQPAFGAASISGLTVNGMPIEVSDTANQQITIPNGTIVINEQTSSAAGTVVNGLHIVINGVADVVVASATANAQ